MQTSWEFRYAQRTQRIKSSTIRELLKLTEQGDVISFAGGLPAPEVFPIEDFKEACNKVLTDSGPQALQYSTTEGYLPLREIIAAHTCKGGLNVTPDNILITSGSQQALDLLGEILINPGDHILMENPTYMGALQAWNPYGAEYLSIVSDQDGMNTDELDHKLRCGPKLIYVLPTFQNPTGVTMSMERRQRLVEMADKYGVPMIEDDPYGQLRFEGEHLPQVITIDGQYRKSTDGYSGNVIYLSTFSKIMAPGVRLAWVIGPAEVIRKLALAKQGADLHTATFNQMVAYEVGKHDFFAKHIQLIKKVYRERRDVMLEALDEHMPGGVKWTHPQGGLFLWLTLPEGVNTTELLMGAVKEKVAFVPGANFHPNGGGDNTMRLNFSYSKPDLINEGIYRLGRALKKYL